MRLMSFCTRPTVAANKAVVAPKNITTACAVGASSNSGDNRATMKTPAVTMVAAWIKAETAVGPSMASGSQVCRRNWADLPIAPMNSTTHVRVSASACQPHTLPAEKHLHQIIRGHQHQHREGEQRQIAEEARPVRVLVHVADRIEMHERRYGVDHHQHYGSERIDPQRPRDLQVA